MAYSKPWIETNEEHNPPQVCDFCGEALIDGEGGIIAAGGFVETEDFLLCGKCYKGNA